MYYSIDLMSDSSERVHYNVPNYPVFAGRARISVFREMRAVCHWHDDFEFCVVLSGSMRYYVNGETLAIEAGQGLFVNARQSHFNSSVDSIDAEYICVLIHPSTVCADPYIRETYLAPIMENGVFSYRLLCPDEEWARTAMALIVDIWSMFRDQTTSLGLLVQSAAFRVMALLYEHRPKETVPAAGLDRHMATLHAMIGFIQRHYAENISLNDIARAGGIGKSGCCAIFYRQLGQTPTAYLTSYRLKKSQEMLRSSSLRITEIALVSGFSSPSYFTEVFHRHTGMTPSEYRKRAED